MTQRGRFADIFGRLFSTDGLMRAASVLFVVAALLIFVNGFESGSLVCDRANGEGECVFTKDTLWSGKRTARVPVGDIVSAKYFPVRKAKTADFHLFTANERFVHNAGNCNLSNNSNNLEMVRFLEEGKAGHAEVGYDCEQGFGLYGFLICFAVVLWLVSGVLRKQFAPRRLANPAMARLHAETLFSERFPELQPHLHPRCVVSYVAAHLKRTMPPEGVTWPRPPGFKVDAAEIRFVNGEQFVRLLDAEGAEAGAFTFVPFGAEYGGILGALLRVAVPDAEPAQMFVLLQEGGPVVEYRHPDRQFRWHLNHGFAFRKDPSASPANAAAEKVKWDTSPSSERQSPSSWSPGNAEAAAIATFVAAGGAFGGAGASEGWSGWSESSTSGGSSDSWGSESSSWSGSSDSASSSDYFSSSDSSSSDSSSSSSDSSSSSSDSSSSSSSSE